MLPATMAIVTATITLFVGLTSFVGTVLLS